MKSVRWRPMLAMSTLLVSGCAPSLVSATPTETPPTEAPPPAEATATAHPTPAGADYEDTYGYATEETSPAPPPGPATIDAAETSLGLILVDGDGFTVYMLTSDSADQSTCSGGCSQSWPPVLVVGEVIPGAALDPALIGTLDRGGGAIQVTYAGWPLYRFAGDDAPGDVTGQGRGGVWFVLRPSGEVVR